MIEQTKKGLEEFCEKMNDETNMEMNTFTEKVSQCHAEIAALEASVLQVHTVFNRQKTDNIKLIEKYAHKFGLN